MKQNVFNTILGSVSIAALVFSLLKITPFEISSETYIGIIVSALSIAATLIIGYQIYNTIEIKNKLKQFDKKIRQQNIKYKLILEKNTALEKELQIQNSLFQGGLDIINANFEQDKGNEKAALYFAHHSLSFYLASNMNDFQPIFNIMRKNIATLSIQSFSFGRIIPTDNSGELIDPIIISDIIAYKDLILSDGEKIKGHPNFAQIKTEYERVINHFSQRINHILKHPNILLTEEEKTRILNPS